MDKAPLWLTLGALGAALIASPVSAQQQNCAERATVVERLQQKYGESRQSMGLGRNNGVIEVFASEETGTWTIFISTPNGMACLLAAGDYYEHVAETLPQPVDDDA